MGGDVATDVGDGHDADVADMAHDVAAPTDDGDMPVADAGDMSDVGEPFDPAAQSGSRLMLRAWEADGGARMTTGFWDTQLQTACTFTEASDGVLRCLPTAFLSVAFADATCSVSPVAVVSDECTDEEWAFLDGSFYRKTNQQVSGDTLYVGVDSSCTATSLPANRTAWTAELVPIEDFVAGTTVDELRNDGFLARVIEGEDGSRIIGEARDTQYGFACEWDEDLRCLPAKGIGFRLVYGNPECTAALIHANSMERPDVLILSIIDVAGCLTNTRYFVPGTAAPSGVLLYVNRNGICEPFDPYGVTYAIGPEIDVPSLPVATASFAGDGVLVAKSPVDSDGLPLGPAVRFETRTAEGCEPVPFTSGETLCTPASYLTASRYFSTSDCAEENGLFTRRCGVELSAAVNGGAVCDRFVADRVFEVGPQHTDDGYILAGGDTCLSIALTPDYNEFYNAGPEITDDLPRLIEHIEGP